MAGDPVKIAVLTDMSGPVATIAGNNVEAARMAIEDFGATLLGEDIVFIYRDHQDKTEVASQMAVELYEKEKVDAIFDCPNSTAALAVSHQALIQKKLFFSVGSGTTLHTGAKCNRYTFDWTYNTYVVASTVGLWAAENLGEKWFTITADYAWGHDLLKHFTHVLNSKGGTLIGNEMAPLGAADFSSYILKAKKANPDVLVLLNAGRDSLNAAKRVNEFGIKKKIPIVHAALFLEVINAAGPEVYAGDYGSVSWYWDNNYPGNEEFVEQWREKFNHPPNVLNAGTYSAVTQYLEAVKRAGTKDPKAVIKELEGHTFRDLAANPGYIRPEDHMQINDMYIVRVKKPEEIKKPDGYFEVVGVIPAKNAYMDPAETGCNMGGF
ncbi:MAG: ABC transporter substrate-binding protein [bacterium]|nr:ABC transporter substrate-binding protein [bacterium]